MERLKQKQKALRSQVTKFFTEIDAAYQNKVLVEEEFNILLTRLDALHSQLTETNTAIKPLAGSGWCGTRIRSLQRIQ